MPRDRNKRYKAKPEKPAPIELPPAPEAPARPEPSQAALQLAGRIAQGGPDYLMKNMEHVLIDSYELAEEPEFEDLAFDSQEAMKATERWSKRFESRLAAAEKQGEEAFDIVYDDMRIEIINQLVTPALRKEVRARAQAMLDRLMGSEDIEKLEIALLLPPLLNQKKIPWGIFGLILAIYERSIKEEMEMLDEQANLFSTMAEAFKATSGEALDMEEVVKNPKKFESLAEKVFQDNPEVFNRAEEQAWKMATKFEGEILQGKIILDLFSQEELAIPVNILLDEKRKPITDQAAADPPEKRFIGLVVKTINDLMTPERYQRLQKDLQTIHKEWAHKGAQWAMTLQFELGFLEEPEYELNKFLIAVFIGQLTRAGMLPFA